MSKLRVLVIGSGRRVQRAGLAALARLEDSFEIGRIYARTAKIIEAHGRTHRVAPLDELTQADLDGADLIYMAVAKDAVPEVLTKLSAFERGSIDMLIDTPVVRFKHYRHAAKLRGFRNVWVSEDTTTLPWFDTLDAAVAGGAIGERTELVFDRSAYAYHAVAMAKRVIGSNRIKRGKRVVEQGPSGYRVLDFANGTRVVSHEQRDYSVGSFVLKGTRGAISDRAGDGRLVLEPIVSAGKWTGFRVGDVRTELAPEEIDLLRGGDASAGIVARTDDLKSVGFYRLLKQIESGRGTYPLEEGLDDMLVDYHLEKFKTYFANPFTSQRGALTKWALGLLTRAGG